LHKGEEPTLSPRERRKDDRKEDKPRDRKLKELEPRGEPERKQRGRHL
jgi:hypothetical protein